MGNTESRGKGPSKVLSIFAALLGLAGLVLLGLGLYGTLTVAKPNMTGFNQGDTLRIGDNGMSVWARSDAVREAAVCVATQGGTEIVFERPVSEFTVAVGDSDFYEVGRTPGDTDAGEYTVTCQGAEEAVYAGPRATRTIAPGVMGDLGLIIGGALLGLALLLGLAALLTRGKGKKQEEQPYQYHAQGQQGFDQQGAGYPAAPTGYQQGGYDQQQGGYPQQSGYDQHQGSYYDQQQSGYQHQGGYDQQQSGYQHQGGYDQQQGGETQSYGQPGTPTPDQYGQQSYGQQAHGQDQYGQSGGYGTQQPEGQYPSYGQTHEAQQPVGEPGQEQQTPPPPPFGQQPYQSPFGEPAPDATGGDGVQQADGESAGQDGEDGSGTTDEQR